MESVVRHIYLCSTNAWSFLQTFAAWAEFDNKVVLGEVF